MPHVFISYAWLDGRELATALYNRFNAEAGWSAWMDLELHADSVFSHALQMQIDRADKVVVVVSPEVNRRDPPSFVQRELGYATDPLVKKPVYAIRAEQVVVPLVIWGVTFVDCFDQTQFEAAFQQLLSLINRHPKGSFVNLGNRRGVEEAYLREVARQHGFFGKVYVDTAASAAVDVTPAPPPSNPDPDIAEHLDSLLAAIHPPKGHSPKEDTRQFEVQSFAALTEALGQFERVAIIGDPGSGKTTTLRRFAYHLAELAANDPKHALPIYVPLGGFMGGDLATYIQAHFASNLPLSDYLPADDNTPSRVILLLDGLNETARDNVPAVEKWLKDNLKVRVLLTCRKLDYTERELPLQRVDVLPLDIPRILSFMAAYKLSADEREDLFWGLSPAELRTIWEIWRGEGRGFDEFWFGEGVASKTSTAQDEVLKRARQNIQTGHYPGLLGLARNPFLLTITISLYQRNGGQVPRNRAELFGDFVSLLFKERGQPAADKTRLGWIDVEQQTQALTQLAYRMQAQQKATRVPYAWARGVVAQVLPQHDPDHVLYLAASAGLIDKGEEVAFTHQLLLEYFVARHLRDLMLTTPATNIWKPANWWEPTGWEETAILLAGLYSDDPTPVLDWLKHAQPELTARCVLESGANHPPKTTLDDLRTIWLPRLTNLKTDPDPSGRATVGRGVSLLNLDTRPGIGLNADGLPEFDWVKIPGGKYRLGGDKKAFRSLPETEVELKPFALSRYPVTVAQYAAFVNGDGYTNREYWTEAGWAWRERDNITQPGYWNDPEWHIPNHPVVGVSWFEAYAFTQWASQRLGQTIRLPHEHEWEAAARGRERRIYAWGDDWDPRKCNAGETGIRRTSAVGLFPTGATPDTGLLDMTGNVWEWCVNDYDTGSVDININNWRVLRGGSWNDPYTTYFRAAFRNRLSPDGRYNIRGFRVSRY
jgi:formylglycine-generating enzyme required for sulfatase activity